MHVSDSGREWAWHVIEMRLPGTVTADAYDGVVHDADRTSYLADHIDAVAAARAQGPVCAATSPGR